MPQPPDEPVDTRKPLRDRMDFSGLTANEVKEALQFLDPVEMLRAKSPKVLEPCEALLHTI